MTDPIIPGEPHDQAEELLPWYATGQLDELDRTRVKRHLSECAQCREQVAAERRLVHELRSFSPEVESGWARVRARIAVPAEHAKRGGPSRSIGRSSGEFWASFRRPIVRRVAVAQVAFASVAAGFLLWLSHPAYHALGSAPPPASANLIVMFRVDATEQDMRDALRTANASIVSGPTAAGAYLVHVPAPQRRAAATRLQSDHVVQLAQPIDGGTSP
jgi:anti-sigma factor RsiW